MWTSSRWTRWARPTPHESIHPYHFTLRAGRCRNHGAGVQQGNQLFRRRFVFFGGKRSAALGKQPNMNTSLFPSFVVSRLEAWNKQNSGKGKVGVAWHLPRAAARLRCAPAGLALGYYLAAPSGRRRSADSCFVGARAGQPKTHRKSDKPPYRTAARCRGDGQSPARTETLWPS